ncbi:MAG TPA: hypothetical protein VNA65_11250 [Candidatus Dormibacteraeota bacterium]|nr:hypothetical protein [Candidatus Dormibacteraeota bacterium]
MPIKTNRSVQLHVRIRPALMDQAQMLARRRRVSVSQLIRSLVQQQLERESSGSIPDESAIREMAILIAVELVLKLQEASMPGGITLSRRLVEDAVRAAIERIELVEAKLQRGPGR